MERDFDIHKWQAKYLHEATTNTKLDVEEYRLEHAPHIKSDSEGKVDFLDAMEFAKEYARYVAEIASQEFLDTTLPKQAIDEFLRDFKI